jgi:octaprenyl-diphosphate synthase
LDYAADAAELGKTIGDDFREGKLTYPVLLAVAEGNGAESDFWTRTIGEGDQTEADLATALGFIRRHDTITRTIARASEFAESAIAAIDVFPASPLKDNLQDVARYTTARGY